MKPESPIFERDSCDSDIHFYEIGIAIVRGMSYIILHLVFLCWTQTSGFQYKSIIGWSAGALAGISIDDQVLLGGYD